MGQSLKRETQGMERGTRTRSQEWEIEVASERMNARVVERAIGKPPAVLRLSHNAGVRAHLLPAQGDGASHRTDNETERPARYRRARARRQRSRCVARRRRMRMAEIQISSVLISKHSQSVDRHFRKIA